MTGVDEERNALLLELKWVHRLIRQDLEACRQLADRVASGATPTEVRSRVWALQSRELLAQLGTGCLRHCRFVHAHHGAEDALLFPAVRKGGLTLMLSLTSSRPTTVGSPTSSTPSKRLRTSSGHPMARMPAGTW